VSASSIREPSTTPSPRHAARTTRDQRTPWSVRGPLLLVGAAVLFGLISLWPERTDVWYLNDATVHRSMVRWAADRIRDGHLPFDGWYPYLSLGASRFHHYQSLPHILTGAASLAFGEATFRWSLYLLLATWPIAVYAGGRLLGLDRWAAAGAALLSPLIASAPGLGYEWGSYVWRGAGTWAQLWGMWVLPFAWGLSWRAISGGRRIWLASLVTGLLVCLHLLTGYLALCSLAVFVLVVPRELPRRIVRAALVGLGSLAVAAWMLVPLIADAGWTVNDEFSRGTFYYDSFGARRILGWLVRGQLFDEGRLPVVTALVGVGIVVAIVRARRMEAPRVILGLSVVSMVLFFGRPTLGPVLDLLPGGADLFLRRFISGVHLGGLYLAGLGGAFLAGRVVTLARRRSWSIGPVAVAVGIAGALVVSPAIVERVGFERQGARWIGDQITAQGTDGLGFEALVDRAMAEGGGRIFAGLRGPRNAPYRVGSVPGYAALLNLQADAVGFTRPTWSLASPAEFRFRIDDPAHPDLFGVRFVLRPEGDPMPGAERVAAVGRHVLWELPRAGYMQVVDTIAPVAADRGTLGQQLSSVLTSGLPARGFLPTLAFGGRTAAEPTLGKDELPRSSPGEVLDSSAEPADGVFLGNVSAERDAVVLVKASFDPRWDAAVDGQPVEPQMIAPAFVGIPVTPGTHEVSLVYHPYPHYLWLFLLGAGWVLGSWWIERAVTRRRLTPVPA
jgi:hypothetical protein